MYIYTYIVSLPLVCAENELRSAIEAFAEEVFRYVCIYCISMYNIDIHVNE